MAASSSDEIWQAHTPAERISIRQCPRGQTDREGCVAKQAPGLAPNWAGFHSWFHNLLSTTSSLPLPRCRRALIHLLLWAERCPPCHPNSYADVLIPSTSDCNFTWGKGYALWFKRGPEGGLCLRMTGILPERGNLETGACGEHHVEMKPETGVMLLQAKEHQRCQPSTRRWGGGWQEQSPPHSLQKEPTLPTPWSQTTSLQKCDAIHLCQFSHVVLRALLQQETNREPCSVKSAAVGLMAQSARSGTWHRQQIHVHDEHRMYHIVWI